MASRLRLHQFEPPRLITENETAHLLGMAVSTFSRRASELEAIGLPTRHPVLGRRDRIAIQHWLDRLSGLAQSPVDVNDVLTQRLAAMRTR